MAERTLARTSVHTAGWTWSAVGAGVIASLIVQVILVMIGFGVGLISLGSDASPTTAAWLVFAWWIFSGIFAAAVGGWVAGMFSPTNDEGLKGFSGLAAWAIATLIVVGASGFVAGSSATAVGAMGGPAVTALGKLQAAQNRNQPAARRETVGRSNGTELSADQARNQFATAMLVSAIALILGAIAAYFSGRMSPGRDFVEEA
ncbi:MAG TPA: hypothetical protein VFP60_01595 [Pseudolabrys sp.]|nr:hypothetical protein [Pseudolabrys sp.]